MKNRVLMFFLLMILGLFCLDAETFRHRQAGISITFPDSWRVKMDEDILEAFAPGDEAYFQLLVLDAEDLDEAAEVYDEMLDQLVSDYEVTQEGEIQDLNGLSVFFTDGRGNVDGVGMAISVAVIQAPDAMVMAVTFCAEENVAKFLKQFEKIAGSIRAI